MQRKSVLFATLLAAGMIAPGIVSLNAQQGDAPPPAQAETPTSMMDVLSQKLDLSDDQKAQIQPILDDRRAKITALRNDQSLGRLQRMHKARKILEESDKKMNAILNPDQQKKYAELEQQMHAKMRERMQQGQSGAVQ